MRQKRLFLGGLFCLLFFSNDLAAEMRDPFRIPRAVWTLKENPLKSKGTIQTELESYPLESYKLLGVLTGPEKVKAMLSGPRGKTYFVSEKTKIGLKSGIIFKIHPDRLVIREKGFNLAGKEETRWVEIGMERESPSSLARAEVQNSEERKPEVQKSEGGGHED